MSDSTQELGKLVSIHPVSPVSLQRAFLTAMLSLIFFAAMTAVFYFRQNILYFLMATGFLIVYLLLMASFIFQRKSIFSLYENGFIFKRTRAHWDEIASLDGSGIIRFNDNRNLSIPKNLVHYDDIVGFIRQKTG